MPARPDSIAAPFEVLVLLVPPGGLEAALAVLAELPGNLPAVVLIGPSQAGNIPAAGALGRPLPHPTRWIEDGTVLQPDCVYLTPPGTMLEVRPGGRCAVTPPGDLPQERPLDRLLGSLAVSSGARTLAVIQTDLEGDGFAGVLALRGVGGTVLVQHPPHAERPPAVAEVAHRVVLPGELGRTVTQLLTGREITGAAAVQAEQALRASEEKYRALFEQMDEAYAVVEVLKDASGRWTDFQFLEVNAAFVRHTGMPYPVGRTATELLGTPNPRWAELYGRAVDTGEPVRVEENELTLGRVFDLNIFRLGGEGSRQVAVLFTDITERKAVEAALHESEERQAFLLRLSDALRPLADPVAIQETACRLTAEHLDVGRVTYCEVESEPDIVVFVERDWPRRGMPAIAAGRYRMGDFGPFLAQELTAGRPATVAEAATDPRLSPTERANWSEVGITASCALPVVKEGRFVAYLVAQDNRRREWTGRETALLGEVAERLWATVERARTEAARRESEENYRSLFDTMAEGFAVCGVVRDAAGAVADFRYLAVNRGLERQTGLDRRTLIGRRLSEVLPEADLARWLPIYAAVIGSGEPVAFEEYAELLDRWFAVSIYPRPGDELAVFFHDVTERKQAEAVLRESGERQAFLLGLSDALRPLADPVEIQSEATRVLGQHFGAGRAAYAEIEADDAHFIVHRDYTDGVPSFAGRYPLGSYAPRYFAELRAGRTVRVTDAERDAQLSEADRVAYGAASVRAAVAVPLVKGGRLAAIFFLHFPAPREWTPGDVALAEEVAERTWAVVERARAEAALRASEARFRTVVNLVPDLLWESQPDGGTSWYNQRWLEYSGQTPERATGWGWTDVIHPEDRELSAQQYRQAIQRGQPLRQEHRIRRHDGEYRWFVLHTAPLLDERGEVVRVYGAATDVHHLRTLNATLEERVEERTRRLADLNAELGALITRTARNLEAPVGYLSQFLDPGCKEDLLTDLSPHDPSLLEDELVRLRGVSQDLRELARLEDQHLNRELLPLSELFEEVRVGAAEGSRVQWLIEPLPIVRADRALLRQALEVLLTFTLSETRGARYVDVGSQEVEGEVWVTVRDDGTGLSGEEAATLFDLSVRTEQPVPLLAGSGLVQVRRILARHGGWAWAESGLSGGKVVLAFPRDETVSELEALFRQERRGG